MTRQSLESEIDELILELSEKNIAQKDWESFKATLLKTVNLYVEELIGEDESLASHSEYDKQHFGHPEADAIVNLHYVRQATRNQFREALRQQVKEDV